MTSIRLSLTLLSFLFVGFLATATAHADIMILNSVPSGATVLINGVKRGQTPFRSEVTSGQYHVELRYGGYLTWTSYVTMPSKADMTLRIRMQRQGTGGGTSVAYRNLGNNQYTNNPGNLPRGFKQPQKKGLLVIRTNPTGISVYIDGRMLGTTPLLSYLPVGQHTVVLQQQGYQTVQRTIQIKEAKSTRMKLRMRPGSGGTRPPKAVSGAGNNDSTQLMLLSTPSAKVYLDGRSMGMTPVISAGLKPGQFKLRMVAKGHQVYNRTIRLYRGQHLRIKALLVPKGR